MKDYFRDIGITLITNVEMTAIKSNTIPFGTSVLFIHIKCDPYVGETITAEYAPENHLKWDEPNPNRAIHKERSGDTYSHDDMVSLPLSNVFFSNGQNT